MWLVELPLLAVAGLFTGYLALVAAAALVVRPPVLRSGPARHRFAVVIPAHNEAATLPALLAGLDALDYPRPRYEVAVVADNCDDDTAAVALARGTRVLTRTDATRRGKGAALGWAFAQLLRERRHDAFVVLDADTRPAPDLLTRLDASLRGGASAAQGYCAVANPRESWRTALMAADMALIHYLRPAGRQALGGSADIHGNGFCLTRAVLRQVPWETASVAEDHEYHLRLLFHGVRSVFVPSAVVYTVMEPTMKTARSQELRWEGGRFGLARRSLGALLGVAWARRSWTYLDAALDLAIPPFALLAAGTAGMVALHALHWLTGSAGLPALLWAGLLAGQAFYVFTGCALARVPARAYAALFVYGPLYAMTKVWYCLLVVLGGTRGWVPTPRKTAEKAA
jgi:cellulose synthase/poly-beta-1,6-N-acetylglucosamine synthase-like glycosyltransferase